MLQESLYTLDQVRELEDDYELDEGRLVPVTRPRLRHGKVCGELAYRLIAHCKQTQQGLVLTNDAGFVLNRDPDTLRGPDLAVIRAHRVAEFDLDAWGEGAPDVVVEVVSPGDRPGTLHRKIAQYLDAGCQLVWVLYPERHSAVVYDAAGLTQVIGPEGELTGEPVLPGLRVSLADLFQ